MAGLHRHRIGWALLSGLVGVAMALASPAAMAAKTKVKATSKSIGKTSAKARGPVVIQMPSPPEAKLPAIDATLVNAGCAGMQDLHGLGYSAAQIERWIGTPQTGGAFTGPGPGLARGMTTDKPLAVAACRPFATVATVATVATLAPVALTRPAPPASLALLPWGFEARSVLLVTRPEGAAEPATRWVEIEPVPEGLRELWLPMSPSAAALENVPATLHNELLLLMRMLKKQSNAPDGVLARVWLLGDEDTATMPALELVDPVTAQAYGSTVWLARDEGGGAYVSSNGIEVERMLWQSPVDHLRVSRGIGASSMLVQRRVVETVRAVGKGKSARGGKAAPSGKVRKGGGTARTARTAKSAAKRTTTRIVVRTFQYKGQHVGIDYAAPTGTPVVAVADGEIEFAGWRGGYGNLVLLRHGNELSTYYGHLSAFGPGVQVGTHVKRGQTIGMVGSTGFSTGPHLHFEIRKGDRYIDPTRQDVQLPEWTLQREEHPALLTRLLQLGMTRQRNLPGITQPRS